MSNATPELRPQENTRPLVDTLYTICPVLTAAHLAVELGWLDEEFERSGARAIYLRSLENNAGWLPHFTHSRPNLFRDGGAIPTIQARADLASDTQLIGLTWSQHGGQILVKARSGIRRVADLKGRRIGLPRSLNQQKVDFSRGTAERGILLALELAGLGPKDVELVDIEERDSPEYPPLKKPSDGWARRRQQSAERSGVRNALVEGRVDAVFSRPATSRELEQTGEYTVIEDLTRYPDWTLQVANGPYTIAVNREFAETHPEIPIAYLRASIRAGRWGNKHRAAAAEIFTRVAGSSSAALIEELLEGVDLVPNLSAKNLAAIEIEKQFLLEHAYVKNDFDVRAWANPRYLEEALRSLG